jgi:hypothetical protein
MAIVENPKIGRTKGSVGNVVFFTRNGQNIIRTKPLEVKNPKTPAQEFTKGRFKKLILVLKQVLVYINAAYAGSVEGMSTHNRVMSINKKNCFFEGTTSIDPSLFVFCENDGSFVDNVVLSSTSADTITGTFNSNAQNAEEEEDPVRAYGFHAEGDKIWQFEQSAIRKTGTILLTKPEISGLEIAVYFECLDRVNLLMGKPKHVIKYVGIVRVI